ncbi:unnamed protein product, partial [Urochloa humidicola]
PLPLLPSSPARFFPRVKQSPPPLLSRALPPPRRDEGVPRLDPAVRAPLTQTLASRSSRLGIPHPTPAAACGHGRPCRPSHRLGLQNPRRTLRDAAACPSPPRRASQAVHAASIEPSPSSLLPPAIKPQFRPFGSPSCAATRRKKRRGLERKEKKGEKRRSSPSREERRRRGGRLRQAEGQRLALDSAVVDHALPLEPPPSPSTKPDRELDRHSTAFPLLRRLPASPRPPTSPSVAFPRIA